jgi:crotonobetainyl-CoA:carnitine CoA-transferase CaiB-like acyl-CoA transferase
MAEFTTNPARLAHRDELRGVLNDRLSAHPAAHWISVFSDAGVPAGLINTISEAFEFARELGLDVVVPGIGGNGGSGGVGGNGALTVANPITIAGHPVEYHRAPPTLNQHPLATWLPDPIDSSPSDPHQGTP